MQIQQVMTPDPIVITPNTSAQKAASLMSERDIGSLLVGETDDLKGFVTDRDIAIRVVGKGRDAQTPVEDVMTQNVITCTADEDAEEVVGRMREKKVLRMAVVNDDGKLCGIVSHGDLARAVRANFSQDKLSEDVADLAAQDSADQRETA